MKTVARAAGLALALTSTATAATAAILAAAAISAASTAAEASPLTVGAGAPGRAIPSGFLGLSIEIPGFAQYAGDDPDAPNPIMIQLIKNLTPGQRPVIRLGGDSTDWSWWPVKGMSAPPGIRFTITKRWLDVSRAVTEALNARLILGINLEADNAREASGEARALLGGFGRANIQALELGNEPELYDAFPWYKLANGNGVLGRPKSWDYSAFASDFASIVRSLPPVALAAPSIGSPAWSPNLSAFLRSQPRTAIATLHRYPLKRCRDSTHLTVGQLLSTMSTTGLANEVIPYAATAHTHHIPLRIDEMNSISCGGQPGLSDTYTSALWALDALYEMARAGVDGVNIHTFPTAVNQLFFFHHGSSGWTGNVQPLYYGLLMFAHAAPPGSRIVNVSGKTPAALRVWATKTADGTVRVVLINDGSGSHTISFRAPAAPAARVKATATLERLQAPNVTAQSGITLGGRSFPAPTTTGLLDRPVAAPTLTPHNGVYTVTLPPYSAALVTAGAH